MDASLYLSMSAMKQNEINLQIVTSNLANANTDGFKRDTASFKALYLNQANTPIPVAYTELNGTGVDLAAGQLKATGNGNDLVIGGNGFVELKRPDGSSYYTKTLSLMTSANGTLVNVDGGILVNGKGKPITPPSGDFVINAKGNILTRVNHSYEPLDHFKIVELKASDIKKDSYGQIILNGDVTLQPLENANVIVGFKESSNVNSVTEMARMVQIQRDYELGSKALNASKTIQKVSNSILE
ncbi:flagellar hook basal-body protein [Photobacterium kishitanii]|uniref:Uncharacterized protein n=1 Tax=Photobacterium kishitanii TaxID=318456 RepID=A0A2T3KMU6_9GAMM|nr:flagellar hook basal-body protein [Photobacterium kishitanii]PSV01119.1 hypothetical protein C9J27_03610 [Photobacterium kishitanii]